MSNETAHPYVSVDDRMSREHTAYVSRTWSRIEHGDWERWMRLLSGIAETKPRRHLRDFGFFFLAVFFESLVTGFVNWAGLGHPLPLATIVLFVIAGAALPVTGAFLYCDRLRGEQTTVDLKSVLIDMKEVQERSDRIERQPLD